MLKAVAAVVGLVSVSVLGAGSALAAPWTSDLEAPPPMRPGALFVSDACPEDADWPTASQQAGRDVQVTLPKDRICQPRKAANGKLISILGGTQENPAHNIHVIGGEIVNVHGQGALTEDLGAALLRFTNVADGTIFIEGVKLDARATCEDLINTGFLGENVRVVIQNVWGEGAGTCGADGTHGDLFHAQGSGKLSPIQDELKVQNFFGKPLGQGFFVPPRVATGHGVKKLELDHVYLVADDISRQPAQGKGVGWVIVWQEPNGTLPAASATFRDVSLDGTFNLPSSPRPSSMVGNCAVYPAEVATGMWCKGAPPEGSPVREDMVGRNYNRAAFTGTTLPDPVPDPELPVPPVVLASPTPSGTLIDSGGAGDHHFIGGSAVDRGVALKIEGTDRPRIYQTERWGLTGYAIPVDKGTYDVRAHFVETYQSVPGNRIFSVTVEGRALAEGMDVFKEAGGKNKALVREIRDVIVSDGSLDVAFVGGGAMISALEVYRSGVLEALPPPVVVPPVVDVPPVVPPVEPPPPVVVTGQCDPANVPGIAKSAGLTRLAFCDDFSADTVARGDNRAIRDGKKWTTERATVFWSTPDPAENFKFNDDGTLTVQPKYGTYNWFMSSTYNDRRGNLLGWWLKKEPKWYAEIRWKFEKGSAGAQQPGFWAMDTCHLYGLPTGCPGPNKEYVEPDMWEYVGQNTMATHLHAETPNGQPNSQQNPQGQMSCAPGHAGPVVNNGSFNVMGFAFLGDEQRFTLNNNVYWTRKPEDGCYKPGGSQWRGPMNAGYVFDKMKEGNYPILIGSKPGEIITIDYVRVWLAP